MTRPQASLVTGLSILLSLLIVSPAAGAPLFPNRQFEVGTNPAAVATGDFNGDGRLDVAVANNDENSGDISILLGHGDGTFGSQSRFAAGDRPLSLAVGDFDADGSLDLAVANSGEDDISILLGSGDGTFSPQRRVLLPGAPFDVSIGDFNGDGRQDLAVGRLWSGAFILLGRGDGSFGDPALFQTGECFGSLALGDFNRDGVQDLAAGGRCFDIPVLLGRGDGSFEPPTFWSSPQWEEDRNRAFDVAVADINADGNDDLTVAAAASFAGGYMPASICVLAGNGDGTFLVDSPCLVGGQGLPSLVVADFNRDGLQDASLLAQDRMHVLTGGSGGSMGPLIGSATSAVAGLGAFGDFDGDGAADIARVLPGENSVVLHLGLGNGSFGPQVGHRTGRDLRSVAIGDFNADGIRDLALGDSEESQVLVSLGAGDGRFTARSQFAVGSPYAPISVADFDSDGAQDLAVTDLEHSKVSVHRGTGDGTFGPASLLDVGPAPSEAVAGDFNLDGAQDLWVATAGGLSVLLGLGDGSFGPQRLQQVGVVQGSMAVGDFNRDGVPDLAAARCEFYDNVSVALGLGDGTVSAGATLTAGECPVSIVAADFDGDGALDLATANARSDDVSIFLGHDDGSFDSPLRWFAGERPHSLAAGDFNADGRQDLGFLSGLAAGILLGHGDGTFEPLAHFSGGHHATGLVAVDVDADRRQDLVVTNGYLQDYDPTDNVWVLLNQGPFPNRPPDAVAGAGGRRECSSALGAAVILDGSASSDPDGASGLSEILTYEWFEAFGLPSRVLLGTGRVIELTLPLGTHDITLVVTDSVGAADTDRTQIAVVDTAPPQTSLRTTPSTLSPPNHRLVKVEALVSAEDLCGPVSVVLESITSSEPDDAAGTGDGGTTNDIQGAAFGTEDLQFRLRAERSGSGGGRTYSVVYRMRDPAGNEVRALTLVSVP